MATVTDRTDTPEREDLAAFRLRARSWLSEHAQARRDGEGARGAVAGDELVKRARAFQAAMFDGGLAGLTWPTEFGGQALTSEHQRVFNEEAAAFETPSDYLIISLGMCAPALLELGSDEQRRTHLRRMLRAEEVWCLLLSEPGAGSDVASLQTRAEGDGDEWVLNGQKVWTSGAHHADCGLIVARTDPDVPKHRGLSAFIVDMRAPGVTINPLRQLDGAAHFNEVFFDDVRVPAGNLVGAPGDGWRVAVATLMNERAAIGAGASGQRVGRQTFRSLAALARGRRLIDDPVVRQDLAGVYCRERVLEFIGLRIRAALQAGHAPGPEGSVAKLATATHGRLTADVAMRIAGAGSQAWDEEAADAGSWAAAVLQAPSLSIAGGTNEIQRNIIGERVLGLPKEPQVDRDVPFRELKVGTQGRA